MLRIYFTIVLFLSILVSSAQEEANIWYFGYHAGIAFTSGNPVALTDGQINTQESCGTISDATGHLLFYTDGMTVWNRNHVIMPNGTGLLGQESSSQSGTIVPKPGSTTLFYIFTTDSEWRPNGFRYSVVDMAMNGGLGAVTSEKNILVFTPSLESIAVVNQANNIDFWIVVHGCASNNFYSYSLTSSGLSSTPVTSPVGAAITGSGFDAAAVLKIAPSGSKLAFTSVTDVAQIFDFNNVTGVVSNPITLSTETGELYGLEFSPDESKLYVANSFNRIYQYDLLATNIATSKLTLFNGNTDPGQLQLGPDGKIYIAEYGRNKLAVINNPNSLGLSCDLQMDAIDLGGKICGLGLPAFNRSFFNSAFKIENLCFGSSTSFTLASTLNVTGTVWDFGDGSPVSNSISSSHTYTNVGTYSITVTITGVSGSITKTKTITIYSAPIVATSIPNQNICGGNVVHYDLSQHNGALLGSQSSTDFGIAYFASLTDLGNGTTSLPFNYPLVAGINTIYAKVYNLLNADCYTYTQFTITNFQSPIATAPLATFICDDPSNDGIGQFDLSTKSVSILGTQSASLFTVSYHLNQNDANSHSNVLPINYQNTSNPQTIFARVENNQNPTCYATTSFQIGLNTMPTAFQPQGLITCDDDTNDGKELFDLSQQTSIIIGAQLPSTFTVSYHANLNDANSGTNDLNLSFTNTSNPQTIYARIENAASPTCYATTSFPLEVKAAPVLIMDDNYSNCEGNVVTIAAPSGFSSYSWSTGATTSSTCIATAGNYTLTVTKNYATLSCPTTKSFTVYNSNKATIAAIETQDWTDNQNMITVELSSDSKGDYEYSLDGVHYQNSPIFEGLPSGQYTVYVNDKKGCGQVTEEVFLLMYSKFFTPNGDGYNDVWHVKFSNTEPDMELQIYDRYGKLITIFKGHDFGWDGTLSGKMQFADDYWFLVTRQNGKEFRGHFSLLR